MTSNTDEQKFKNFMDRVDEKMRPFRDKPAVADLVVSVMGHVMQAIHEADEEELGPMGAMFAIGMVANAMTTTFASERVSLPESKTMSMAILSYAMQQKMHVTEVSAEDSSFFRASTVQ